MHEIRPSEFVNYHHVQELDGLEMLKASSVAYASFQNIPMKAIALA